MKYARLGRGGPEVSRICLGMMSFGNPDPGHGSWRAWHVGDDDAAVIVRTAVDGGVNFFDTADSYAGGASEEVTGTLLRPPRGLRAGHQGVLPDRPGAV